MLRLLTAGESHGPGLTVIVDGFPAGLKVTQDYLNNDLARRQLGYGRGGRMKIEKDQAAVRSGIRHGLTTGSPIAVAIDNRDFSNWESSMAPFGDDAAAAQDIALTRPRPGHADFAGARKLLTTDVRNVLERASARHTAVRVVAGSLAKQLLLAMGVDVLGHVLAIGEVKGNPNREDWQALSASCEASPVRCGDAVAAAAMIAHIDAVRRLGDSLGGCVEVMARGLPPGLGHFAEWDRRLDGRLAQALLSVPAVKACEIGDGFSAAFERGSVVHDELTYDQATRQYHRPTNRAGGIEGGMTNGERVLVRGYMKPIPTLARPLRSVDLATHAEVDAGKERTDSCAVPACAVVCEAVVAWELAKAFQERFGGDTMDEMHSRYASYQKAAEAL